MNEKEKVAQLMGLPHIGRELARCLVAAKVSSLDHLKRLGSIQAAMRINPYRPSGSSCRNALFALEGALRGIRWHDLPKADREALWAEYKVRNGG
jgi:DNA transformation protein